MEQQRKESITDKDVELFKGFLKIWGCLLKKEMEVLQLMEYLPLNG